MVTTDRAAPRPPCFFSNADPGSAAQHHLLALMLDSHSTDVLRGTGAQRGQRWLDVGAGGGSISHFLADTVGPQGHVTALDLDPRHILPASNITIVAQDINDSELPGGSYDGVHVRLLTMHLPGRVDVLAKLAMALSPDGVLVVSEWDCQWRDLIRVSPSPAAEALVHKYLDVWLAIGQHTGVDPGWAPRVHQAMDCLGLVDVYTFTASQSWSGGTGICLLHRSNSIARGDLLLQAGFTADELDEFRTLMLDPRLVLSSYLMHTTVGRRL